MRPVLIHTHGIGHVDYSSMRPGQLDTVQSLAAARDIDIVPSVFLARNHLSAFEDVVKTYQERRASLPCLLGFSVEGPLLGRSGGVPPRGIWSPAAEDWERIAALGDHGLRYIVMGPDMGDLDDELDAGMTYRDVIDLCYSHGVRIALGHFQHGHPDLSAERTAAVIAHVQDRYGPRPDVLLTDHLYNDMPRNFTHVWRDAAQRAQRAGQLAPVLEADWTTRDLSALLGPVPATLIHAARHGRLMPFLNFDGDHVDLAICRRTLEFLGAQRIIGITDDTEIPVLAGEDLHHPHDSRLWYRGDGIVAAGTGDIARQRRNVASLTDQGTDFDQLFGDNPRRALRALQAQPA